MCMTLFLGSIGHVSVFMPILLCLVLKLHVFFKKIFLFTYLVAPGLSCGTGNCRSSLRHAKSLVVAGKLLVAACGI